MKQNMVKSRIHHEALFSGCTEVSIYCVQTISIVFFLQENVAFSHQNRLQNIV